ncbi:hypothetical protein GC176_20865 [bacterium]|nr:hypothetical protein [bacterium]
MSGNTEQYEQAKVRVEQKLGFYIHLAVFVLVNALLTAIDLTSTPDELWFYWPLGGWGIGLVLHAVKVFSSGPSALKQRMIEHEMARK